MESISNEFPNLNKLNHLKKAFFTSLLLVFNLTIQAQPEISYQFDNLWNRLEFSINYPVNDLKNADSIVVWQSKKFDPADETSSMVFQSNFLYDERTNHTVLDAKSLKLMNDTDTLFISFLENTQIVYLTYLLPSEVEYIKGGSQYFYRVKKDYIQVRIIIDEIGPLSGATQMFIFNNTEDTPTGYHVIQDDDNLLRVYELGNFSFLETGENFYTVRIHNKEGPFYTFLIQYDPRIEKFRIKAKDERLVGDGVIRLFSESGR